MSGATFNNAEDAAESAQQTAGVPLGGVGAGCCELGRDGRFRNITINNNRTSDARIDVPAASSPFARRAAAGRVAHFADGQRAAVQRRGHRRAVHCITASRVARYVSVFALQTR